jgi:hypothetical protein
MTPVPVPDGRRTLQEPYRLGLEVVVIQSSLSAL